MTRDDQKKWIQEFTEFIGSESVAPPPSLTENILNRVQADLNPNPWKVFSKIALTQLIAGLGTLLYCPQFGLSLTGINGVMGVLMQYGEAVCMFACGAVFVGTSLLVSAVVLGPEEIRALRRNRTLKIGALSLLTLGAFFCLGAEVFEILTLAWMGGSILGGLVSLELGWRMRQWARSRVIYG